MTTYNDTEHGSVTLNDVNYGAGGLGILCNEQGLLCTEQGHYCDGSIVHTTTTQGSDVIFCNNTTILCKDRGTTQCNNDEIHFEVTYS